MKSLVSCKTLTPSILILFFNRKFLCVRVSFFFVDGYLDTEHWSERYGAWAEAMRTCEEMYNRLIADGATPQEARTVLPNSLKTELIITANESEWQHIIDLRYTGVTGAPHPQMKESMGLVVNDLIINSKGRLHKCNRRRS